LALGFMLEQFEMMMVEMIYQDL
jgi:hypothetical protein